MVLSSEPAHAPIHVALLSPANPSLNGSRDHLIQRRVTGQSIGQVAGVVGVGTAKLDGCGCATAFAIAQIEVQETSWAEGDTHGRIESAENVLPIQRTGSGPGIEPVAVVDGRPIVTARNRENQIGKA